MEMERIRYLTLVLVLLAGSIGSRAQDDEPFNPSSPAEPGPSGMPMLTLVADPADGGTVSGAGWYNEGTQVTLRASNKANYVFERWADADGRTVSTAAQFKYTKKKDDETLTACFRFSPGSPAEPTEIVQSIYYQMTLVAEDGGTVSGGGKYLPNTRIYLSASLNAGFVFSGWYDDEGALVSASQNFYYTTLAKPVTLTARFTFNPDSPSEPPLPDQFLMHQLTVTAEEGGTVNTGGSKMKEGATTTLTATANAGYMFKGWYKGDELYNANRSFTFKMGTEDINLVACFTFNPSGPAEPSMPSVDKKYNFYLMNVVTKPGCVAKFPIYLTSVDELRDMTFQLTFPKELTPSLAVEDIEVSAKAVGYTVTAAPGEEDYMYIISLVGGRLPDGNTAILTLSINVPIDIVTGQNYQVKINQVTMTEASGTQTTATTRNGRISVYKNGDANGDDEVNIVDVTSTISAVLGQTPDDFISEAADTNDDEEINIVDVTSTIDIVLGGSGAAARTALAKRKESAQGGNRLTATDVTVNPGGKTALTIGAAFEKADFIGYQLDITLPKGLSLQAGADGRPAATSLTVLDVTGSVYASTAASTTYRFVASKMGNPVIPAGSYALLSVTILADESLTVGEVMNGALSAIKFSDATQHGTDLADVSFSVAISNEVVLDENAATLPEAAEGVDVRVKRTINGGEWSTLCLPFAMTEAQVKAAFGSDVQIGDFAGTDSEFDDDDRVVGITVNFDDVTSIEANHPYIIKVSETIEEFTVSGVDIDADEDGACVEFDNGRSGSRRVVYSGFYGTYHAGTVLGEFTLFLSDNKFWYSAGQTKMKAFRAYFDFLDILTDVEEGGYDARVVMRFGGAGEASGVRSAAMALRLAAGQCYDLQGRRVESPIMRKGLYISDGRKVVVK